MADLPDSTNPSNAGADRANQRNVRRLLRLLATFVFIPSASTAGVLALYPGDHVLHMALFGLLSLAAVVLWLAAPGLAGRLAPHL